uniref:Inner membrane protein n=1 Tax=Heterorhabditis bacteriophora TaxID=37862 RepID=A0A1I7X1U5_HETBA
MTIAVSLNQKPQDSVEDNPFLRGSTVRRIVYCLYITVVAISAVVLYLFPTNFVLIGFIIFQLLLLLSLYPLVKIILMTEENHLFWDSDGLRWEQRRSTTYDDPFTTAPVKAQSHLPTEFFSYSFI